MIYVLKLFWRYYHFTIVYHEWQSYDVWFLRHGVWQTEFCYFCPIFALLPLKLVSAIFLSNFYFFIKWQTFKNYAKCFLFHIKTSFHSQDTQIFVIFSLPFHCSQIQKGKWKWNNLWCHKLACINLQM